MTSRPALRRLLGAVAAMALLAGCGGGIAGTPKSPEGARPAVDPCTVLADADLAQLGMRLETRRTVEELDALGCGWLGEPLSLTLTTNPDTVADYRARGDDPVFVTLEENQVNDRPGVQTQVDTTGEACTQVMGTGPGVLAVGVALSARASVDGLQVDPCAEALRIAELIEPRLPEPEA